MFFWTFFSSKNPEKNVSCVSHKYEAAQLFFNIDNNNTKFRSWAANQHIRVISEGSCDNEDWSNDAENSALILSWNTISQYYCFSVFLIKCMHFRWVLKSLLTLSFFIRYWRLQFCTKLQHAKGSTLFKVLKWHKLVKSLWFTTKTHSYLCLPRKRKCLSLFNGPEGLSVS